MYMRTHEAHKAQDLSPRSKLPFVCPKLAQIGGNAKKTAVFP